MGKTPRLGYIGDETAKLKSHASTRNLDANFAVYEGNQTVDAYLRFFYQLREIWSPTVLRKLWIQPNPMGNNPAATIFDIKSTTIFR
jgi:hypothetical protein